jgi:hypothetical protein
MRQFNPAGATLLLAIVLATPAVAEVYRSVDAQGNVTYTNEAAEGAERVELKPLSVYGAPDLKSTIDKNIDTSSDTSKYKSVSIISPKVDETIRDNPGNVTVTAGSDPVLNSKAGHQYQFFLDGKAFGEPQVAAAKVFPNVDRGEHKAGVAIVDVNGKQLARSESTRFFLKRQTIHNPARQAPTPTPPIATPQGAR